MSNPAHSEEKSSSASTLFSSPFEDTSGLDVFAQIAASIPLEMTSNVQSRRHSSADIVHQSQSQLAQSIYQSQQALRQQQQQERRTSIVSNASSSYSDFEDEDDDEEEEGDDGVDDFEDGGGKQRSYEVGKGGNFLKGALLPQTIQEESESDLAMDVDSSVNSESSRMETALQMRRSSLPANAFSSFESGPSSLSNRRIVHNICERKRRENIREGFERLQARLPGTEAENARLSKMEILQGAVEVMEGLRDRIKSVKEEINALQLMSEQ